LTHAVPRSAGEIPTRKKTVAEIRRLIAEAPPVSREVYPRSAHQIAQYHHLVATVVGQTEMLAPPRIEVSAAEKDAFARSYFAAEIASRLATDTRAAGRGLQVIGLNPGAEYGPAKRWPAERFIEAAALIEGESAWLIFGGAADLETARFIEAGIKTARPAARIINVAGRTSLRELCAGLALCDVVITNDTGPMHLAAAVGTGVVVPFGSTSPELTGPGLPGSPGHRLLLGQAACAPCFLRECPIDFRCMKSIEPARVALAVKSLLSE
jgi:heptosyltransferase-2